MGFLFLPQNTKEKSKIISIKIAIFGLFCCNNRNFVAIMNIFFLFALFFTAKCLQIKKTSVPLHYQK